MNYFFEKSNFTDEAFDFNKINTNDYIPALNKAIDLANEKINQIKESSKRDFSIIEEFETSTHEFEKINLIFSNLHSAQCTEELESISEEFFSIGTKFESNLYTDETLFSKIKDVYENINTDELTVEQKTILENYYQGFVRGGALLNEDAKKELISIDEKLSTLRVKFSEKSRKSKNSYKLIIEDKSKLEGLPEGILEAAMEKANSMDENGKYAFTLDFSSYYPVLQYCKNEEIRKEIYLAASRIAFNDEYDNTTNIKDMLSLRQKRAKLLGFSNHAEYILDRRMAKDPKTVFEFSKNIYDKAIGKAHDEINELKSLKKELTGNDTLNKWDGAFYSEILKKRTLDLDDEVLRPYFKLENTIEGVFSVANKLFGLSFKENLEIPKYHEDVQVFEVTKDNNFVGLFYCDFFPRKTKRAGAWMTEYRSQGLYADGNKTPHVSIVCNFTKSTASKPSLLTLNEVLTLFHEFGHALHGLLSNVKYTSVAGPNVYWDFVELPSQILENWVLEKECLEIFAKHYETGEVLPQKYIEKIKKTNTFLSGLATIRQLSFGHLDMMYHTMDAASINSIEEFENRCMKDFDLYPHVAGTNKSCSFGHIFEGGYSAGYYSYKWAEVLDADAFESFKENGIFDTKTANSFYENILSKGGSVDPMELYKRFKGQEPSVDPLLKRSGLI
ncbi:MAG: M3 family metallopeptidase [Bacteriovoracaceae bacterium]|jgi:peptidyl-dipeptidase Dcp|nr:M3 family metallopeptidase [Bacteriovoracaceae bacterium]